LIYKKITLITPSNNSEKYIEKTIKSVINQNYKNLEYIVIDGGSKDGTLDIIEKYTKYITKFISEKDEGMYYALKKGFELATGEIYGWINSDDILMPGALHSVNKAFNEIEDCHWVTGIPSNLTSDDTIYLGSHSHFKRDYVASEYFNCTPYAIQQESTFFSSKLYKESDGISIKYKLASDYELWAKFFKNENINLINCYVGAFRFHGDQLSSDKEKYLDEIKSIRNIHNSKKYKYGYFLIQIKKIILKLLPSFLSKRLDKKENLYYLNKKQNKYLKQKIW
jgi:glycosyltransferase involved in cell wall biosynthesis